MDNNLIPLKIKRKHVKKFTKKRNPYKAYANAHWNWKIVFDDIEKSKLLNKKGYMKKISIKYGINYSTLRNKYSKWTNKQIMIDDENRGGCNKIFNDKEELCLFNHIKNYYIDKNLPLCNDDIKNIALKQFKQLNKNMNFNASDGWCSYFKKKWKLTSVTPKISRKATHIYTNKQINDFINKCCNGVLEVGHNFFLT